MRILMLVATPVTTDARVMREATTLVEAGHHVHIVGKDVPPSAGAPRGMRFSSASGGNGLRGRPGTGGPRSLSSPQRLARWLLLPEHRALSFRRWAGQAERVAAALQFDVVHAHDFTALPVGRRLAEQHRVPLVYDAHELWFERSRSGRPTPVLRRWQRRQEQRLGGRATAVLTVGEGLAGKLRTAYGWDHVTVVRNTFPARVSRSAGSRSAPTAAVYAGRLGPGRDLETVAAASRLVALPLRLLGPADRAWLERFDPGRCSVEPPVALEHVDAALQRAGLALVTLSERWGNHRIALPNKLFHAVRVGVPVIASDVGELARTVREHGLGVLYRPGDARSFVDALEEAQARYAELVAAVGRSGDELSWSQDSAALLQVYAGLQQ